VIAILAGGESVQFNYHKKNDGKRKNNFFLPWSGYRANLRSELRQSLRRKPGFCSAHRVQKCFFIRPPDGVVVLFEGGGVQRIWDNPESLSHKRQSHYGLYDTLVARESADFPGVGTGGYFST